MKLLFIIFLVPYRRRYDIQNTWNRAKCGIRSSGLLRIVIWYY